MALRQRASILDGRLRSVVPAQRTARYSGQSQLVRPLADAHQTPLSRTASDLGESHAVYQSAIVFGARPSAHALRPPGEARQRPH